MEKEKTPASQPKPAYLSEEQLKRFAAYACSFRDIAGKKARERLAAKKRCTVTPEDLLSALDRMLTVSAATFTEEWAEPFWSLGPQLFEMEESVWDGVPVEGYRGLPTEEKMTLRVLKTLLEQVAEGTVDSAPLRDELRRITGLRSQPVPLRNYEDREKEEYILWYADDKRLEEASDSEVLLYVLYTDELCGKKNRTAMRQKAYACYGGNRAYPCSWEKARDLMTELTELGDDASCAAQLGDIYFFGRTNRNRPQYDKAFYWYSIGMACGNTECIVRVSDLFREGYGVPKNAAICRHILESLYPENAFRMTMGEFDCRFADIAKRMGDLFRGGLGGLAQDAYTAYYFYLQAAFAVRKRRELFLFRGDDELEASVGNAIKAVLPHTGLEEAPARTVEDFSPMKAAAQAPYGPGVVFELKCKNAENGKLQVTMQAKQKAGMSCPLFVTVPQAHFCGMADKLSFEYTGDCSFSGGTRFRGLTATVLFDGMSLSSGELLMGDEPAASFPGKWVLKLPKKLPQ